MLKYIIIIYLLVYNIFSVTNVTINEVDQPLISDVIEVSVVSIHYNSTMYVQSYNHVEALNLRI